MNNKGVLGIVALIGLFIGIIVALTLISPSASNVATSTGTATALNYSVTIVPGTNNTDLIGQELLSTPFVTNNTGAEITSDNYSITEGISAGDGLKRIRITRYDGNYSNVWNVSYSYGREGYIDQAGGRSIANIIVLLAALGVAVVIVKKVLEDGGDILGK